MRVHASWAGLVALVGVGCSSSGQIASKYEYVKIQAVVAAVGGTVAVTAEDNASLAGTTVVIPPNALKDDTTITIRTGPTTIAPTGTNGLGPVVGLGPDGTVFTAPVRLTLPHTALSPTVDPNRMFVYVVEGNGVKQRIENAMLTIPASGTTLSLDVLGFSQYEVALDGAQDDDAGTPDAGPCGICPSNSTCDGVSDCICDTDFTECASGPVCANLAVDSYNCGSCGSTCDVAAGYKCEFWDGGGPGPDAGPNCVCGFGSFTTCINHNDAGILCVDLASDPEHCGICSDACDNGMACVTGQCVCAPGFDACYEADGGLLGCYDFQSNGAHCGSCDTFCPGYYSCVSGTCVCGQGTTAYCPGGALDGGGQVCTDLWSDPLNCATCGHSCACNEDCQYGVCTLIADGGC